MLNANMNLREIFFSLFSIRRLKFIRVQEDSSELGLNLFIGILLHIPIKIQVYVSYMNML